MQTFFLAHANDMHQDYNLNMHGVEDTNIF